ncbi:hypothetical protein ACIQ8G_28740 [Streptomyces sp. NPDC094154]|uniref:aromatic-ring hydroxylase C-terminal domain-containing protein n=1 Tax=Streptomyces sp. NPDC094154 TaxID=3366059 RepID=UPI003805C988
MSPPPRDAESCPPGPPRSGPALPARTPTPHGISGIRITYRAPRGSHPLVGRRVSDLRLADTPARHYEALREGKFVLVGRDVAAAATPWAGRVATVSPATSLRPTLLDRPDGYAAWAAEDSGPDEVCQALTQWLGSVDRQGA